MGINFYLLWRKNIEILDFLWQINTCEAIILPKQRFYRGGYMASQGCFLPLIFLRYFLPQNLYHLLYVLQPYFASLNIDT